MSSRNIAVRKDVYDALRRERRPRESFTKALLRLLNQRGPIEELSGLWGPSGRGHDRTAFRRLRGAATSKARRP